MKQKLVPIISIVVGVMAFFLTYKYLHDKDQEYKTMREEFYKGAVRVSVMVATHDIPSGTAIKALDIVNKPVFKINVGDRAVAHKDGKMLLGRTVLFPIKAGDPVFWSDIEGGEESSGGLASIVTSRMRAISISVGGASAVSGMVQPNDHVDVLGTFSFPSKKVPGEMETVTITVLQDVTVLATGKQMAKQLSTNAKNADSGYNTVTLEVAPREAELLVFAEQMRGRLTLALRNASDVYYESDLPEVDFNHIESKLQEYNLYRQKYILKKKSIN